MGSFMYPPATATPKGGCFLDGQLEGYCLLSRRPSSCASSGLLQNCDLPPPLNSFSPIQKDDLNSSPEPPLPAVSSNKEEQWDDQPAAAEPTLNHRDNSNATTGLLRALRLSQTRAREAERKAAVASMRNRQMLAMFLEESLALSAHRRWVKLLETEVSQLQTRRAVGMLEPQEQGDEDNLPAATAAAFCLAVVLCLGITSLNFVLGRHRF